MNGVGVQQCTLMSAAPSFKTQCFNSDCLAPDGVATASDCPTTFSSSELGGLRTALWRNRLATAWVLNQLGNVGEHCQLEEH